MKVTPMAWSAVLLLLLCLLGGCKGVITSATPLLDPRHAAYPVASGSEVTGQTLNDGLVWETDAKTARLLLVDGAYQVIDPDQPTAAAERFLFRQIGVDEFVVQASNGSEWAYALVVHADRYYLFTFNRTDQDCTILSSAELSRFRTTVKDDRCHVADLPGLVGLLRHLRQRFPHPTSTFSVR
jgi:hypothetical protein